MRRDDGEGITQRIPFSFSLGSDMRVVDSHTELDEFEVLKIVIDDF